MATVRNSLVSKSAQKAAAPVVFQVNGMEVKLTPAIVKNYLVSGNPDAVTDQEIAMFINLCKFAGLNPWLKEAYCIKYGSSPATMVIGKEAFAKRAESNPAYDGSEAGIIVYNETSGEITYRKGTMKLPDEKILGGYAEVWRKDRAHSTRTEVSFEEYAGRTKDGKLNNQWSTKPATMIRKVALVQALREAFPSDLGGMYTAEEQGTEEPVLMNVPMEQPEEPKAVATPAVDMDAGDDSIL